MTYPDNSYITYEYDVLGRLTDVKNSSGTSLAHYAYDALSRRTDLTYANGTGITYAYDVACRLLDVNNVMASAFQDYAYAYDFVGNRTSMTVTDNAGTRVHAYTYDNIYQVTDVNYPDSFSYLATDTTFDYDAVGNRTSVVDDSGSVSYTANALNQYTEVADVNLTYDPAGNMTYDGSNSYYYDTDNRLIKVVRAPGELSAACDTALAFTTGGAGQWFRQTTEYAADYDAAQSPALGDNQSAWMQTTVTGPGTITFRWKPSSEAGDFLMFSIDGQNPVYRCGDIGLGGAEFQRSPAAGSHTLRWAYGKDGLRLRIQRLRLCGRHPLVRLPRLRRLDADRLRLRRLRPAHRQGLRQRHYDEVLL